MKQIFILINLQLVFCTFIYSNDLQKVYYPLKTSEKINIDGNLSDGAWINTIFLSDFIQTDPNFKLKSDVSSNVKIIYNDNSFYFGIVLYDDMNSVKFKSGEYDDWENTFEEDSDYFSIEIDSFNDKQSAFIFTISFPLTLVLGLTVLPSKVSHPFSIQRLMRKTFFFQRFICKPILWLRKNL